MDESSQLANQQDNQASDEAQVVSQDLNTEITAQEEQALVNEVLGLPPQEGGDDGTVAKPAGGEANAAEDSKEGQASAQDGESTDGQAANSSDGQQAAQSGEQQSNQSTDQKTQEDNQSAAELTEPDTTVQTDDLWVEVDRVVTNEDGSTKTEKVKLVYDPENPGAFLPDDFQFVNDKQLFEITEAKREMESLYRDRVSEIEKKVEEYDAKQSEVTTQKEQLAAWDAEIDSMVGAGILEAPKAKPGTPEFAQDPAVQKIDAVFKFMAAQNQQRTKDGKDPIQSFALAYNVYEADASKKAAEEAKQQEIKDKQTKGAMVGGSSAPSAGGGSGKGYYVPGTYRGVQNAELDEDGNLIV